MSHITPIYPYKGQTPTDLRTSLSDPLIGVGIDKLTVSFRCPQQGSLAGWSTKTFQRGHTVTAMHHLPIVRSQVQSPAVRLLYVHSPHLTATYVSFNPSKVLAPASQGLATVTGALDVLDNLVVPLIPASLRPPPRTDWDLYRVDLTVDIETGSHTQQVLHDTMNRIYRPKHHTYVYMNGPDQIGTVGRRSVTRPRLSIYDKQAETKIGPPRVRFDVQCRRHAIRSDFGGKLSDLTPDTARAVFQRELGAIALPPLRSAPRLSSMVLSPSDQKTALEMLGMRSAQAAGVFQTTTVNTQRRHRDFLKRYGLRSIDDLL